MKGRATTTTVRIRRGKVLFVLNDSEEEISIEYTIEDARHIAHAMVRAVRLLVKEREAFRPVKRQEKPAPILKLVKS